VLELGKAAQEVYGYPGAASGGTSSFGRFGAASPTVSTSSATVCPTSGGGASGGEGDGGGGSDGGGGLPASVVGEPPLVDPPGLGGANGSRSGQGSSVPARDDRCRRRARRTDAVSVLPGDDEPDRRSDISSG
jgi:hypothetical protein